MAQVEGDRALARIDAHEVAALVAPLWVKLERRGPHVVATRPLDLDDAGAQVGEKPSAVRTGEDAREVEDGNTLKEFRARHVATIGNRSRHRKVGDGTVRDGRPRRVI